MDRMMGDSRLFRELTAIILAGGQSTRMGRDKALIEIEGVPLLRRVADVALQCTAAVYVVTPWPERYRDRLPQGCRCIQEVPSSAGEMGSKMGLGQGPLVGFARGLAAVETEWVLLLACDLPGLRAEVLRKWVEKLGTVSVDAIALLPRHAKGWEPLCGFYRRRCRADLERFIQQGGRSFQCWLAQQHVEALTVNDPHLFFNCNTPTDLEVARTHIKPG